MTSQLVIKLVRSRLLDYQRRRVWQKILHQLKEAYCKGKINLKNARP